MSPTILPPVALVSAASATPSYTNLVNVCFVHASYTYIKDQATDRGSCFHCGDIGLKTHSFVGCKSHVSETVVIVEAAVDGQSLHVG